MKVRDVIKLVEADGWRNMRDAIIMHLQGMLEDNEPIPATQTTAEYMDISIPNSAA